MFGNTAYPLEGTVCEGCGEEELVWWSEDETEDTMEVLVQCSSCNYNPGKRFISKKNDTSQEALEEVAREIA